VILNNQYELPTGFLFVDSCLLSSSYHVFEDSFPRIFKG
jgi:hypothetical protein